MRFEEGIMDLLEIQVDKIENERLDLYLSKELTEMSRTYIHKLIEEGLVLVNGKKPKPRYLVKKGDFIQVELPEPKKLELVPLDIIYQDDDVLIVNKPKGMVVHPAPGNYSNTLVNALLYHVDNLSSVNGVIRPGIVHRLDKDTSGLLIVAKNDKAHRILSEQLKERSVKRVYMALVYGTLDKGKGIINAPIGRHPIDRKKMAVIYKNSKEAITEYKVLERFKDYSLIEASLHTGRTHQIRVHMAYINHPIVGDPVYSKGKNKFGIETQLLHARKLGFFHPRTGEYMEFEVEPPKDFEEIIELLRKRNR
jgi:23S rRNA pseudouridine1911/1915/1917 synthase